MVKKSNGGYRLIIDLRTINKFFSPDKVKFESLAQLRYCNKSVEWGVTIDIADAYHHLRLH